jgi:type II secretory ATPase GspE/PulE/Tfp pilus assembly ATPase PilB-like protein
VSDDVVEFEPLEGEMELMPPEVYASNLVEWAVERHASDLFISDLENSVQVTIRRLGKVESVRRLARDYGHKLQGHFRVLSGADAGETIRPAEGRGMLATPSGGFIDIRLSAMPTLFGQDVAIRLFDPVTGARSIEQLGFDQTELTTFRDILNRKSGLVLVAGPVASGKSSTLYAAVDSLNDGTRKIHALEDPIEHAIVGVMQTQVNLRAGLDFAELLAAVLRHSPDVIMIGEIRDPRTAATAVRAGSSGQLVLATIHAKTVVEAIDSMLHYGTNPQFLANSLTGVINQRLVRKLCQVCRSPLDLGELEVPDPIRARLGDLQPQVWHAPGCDACFGDGFDALTCVPEIMAVTRPIADAISSRMPARELEHLIRSEGVLSLADTLACRVFLGITTPHEANRAIPDTLLNQLVGRVNDVRS